MTTIKASSEYNYQVRINDGARPILGTLHLGFDNKRTACKWARDLAKERGVGTCVTGYYGEVVLIVPAPK